MDRSGKRRIVTATCVLVAALCAVGQGAIIYVDDDANPGGDGASWQTAYKHLSDALADAMLPEGAVEIRVAQGLYKPDRSAAEPNGTGAINASFYVVYGMTIKGGFAGLTGVDPNERDVARYPSILSGDLAGNDAELTNSLDMAHEPTRADNSYHVVTNSTGARFGGRNGPAGLNTELDGFVITGGYAAYEWVIGAGVYIRSNAHPVTKKTTIRNCTMVGNYARDGGGGLACVEGTLDLVDCRFIQNGALDSGGGIYVREGNVELTGCHFQDNRSAAAGGGVYADESNMRLHGCDFDRNVADGGGALYLSYDDATPHTAELVGCTFVHNRADGGYGGAIANSLNTELRDCRFLANEALWAGGAVVNGWDMTVTNCLFSGNRAGEGGGVIDTSVGEIDLLNCTSHGNRAPQGRFLSWDYGHERGYVHVENSIIADGGNEIWHNGLGPITLNYTDLRGGLAAVHDPNNKVVWGLGNLDADPCFAAPGYWEANGTPDDPNDDVWTNGDYHLKSQAGRWDPAGEDWVLDEVTSPCIDAGDPNSPVGDEAEPNGGRVNIGAYGGTAEASKSYVEKP